MKTFKIKIRNLYGITELDLGGKNYEIVGKKGAGKTSGLDLIRFALTNRSKRDYIIRQGADEGEILIETDTGLSIHRKRSINEADRNIIKQNKSDIQSPEGFLRTIFNPLQLDPVEFLGMNKEAQNRIILDMIDFKWDLNWIQEQFGEIVPEVNYDQNILGVLFEIQAEEGHYFKFRQEVNREARNKQVIVEEIASTLPLNYDANKWAAVNLGDLYKRIEQIRNRNQQIERAKIVIDGKENKLRKHQADLQIAQGAINSETTARRNSLEKQITEMENQIRAYRQEISTLEEKKAGKVEVAKKTYEASVASIEAQCKEYEETAAQQPESFEAMQEEAEYSEKMKSHINDFKRMNDLVSQVEQLKGNSERLTAKIEKARTLPGEILEKSNIPIKGISVKDGKPLINGLPINNLSDGEKLDLCVDVAMQNPAGLNIILIDGVEKLDTESKNHLYGRIKERGAQFIATRTTDDAVLTVIEL